MGSHKSSSLTMDHNSHQGSSLNLQKIQLHPLHKQPQVPSSKWWGRMSSKKSEEHTENTFGKWIQSCRTVNRTHASYNHPSYIWTVEAQIAWLFSTSWKGGEYESLTKKTILTSIIGLKPWNPFCQGKLCGYLIVPSVEKLSNRLLLVRLSFRPQKVYIGGTAETSFRCLCQIQRTPVKLVANQLLILTLPKLAVVVCQSHLIDLTQADWTVRTDLEEEM